MMDILGMFSGKDNIASKIIDTAKEYFPPDMSEADKLKIEMAMKTQAHQHQLESQKQEFEIQKEFNNRIKAMEGTASDLKSIPFVGAILLTIRGMQRPAVIYMTLFVDIMHFSGVESFQWDEKSMTASTFMLLNALTMFFLFGERAVKNAMPLIGKHFGRN
ncbi:MAG: hypothetical protein HQM14_21975 [SAR324 cluster bacterium]|nr:hypothetical protein [SAR324 cluster bacterium]